jgi:hypothetical protein
MDFGLARLGEAADASGDGWTDPDPGAGAVTGTPGYMSPEQALGLDMGPATDLYGLGATLYEMIGGAPPVRGQTDDTVAAAVLSSPPPPLVPAVPGLPTGVAALTMRCLSRNPNDRPQNAHELACRFREIAAEVAERGNGRLEASVPPMLSQSARNTAKVPPVEVRGRSPWRRRFSVVGAPLVTACVTLLVAGLVSDAWKRVVPSDRRGTLPTAAKASPRPTTSEVSESSRRGGDRGESRSFGAGGDDGKERHWLVFEDSQSRVDCPLPGFDMTKPFTIEAWVRLPPPEVSEPYYNQAVAHIGAFSLKAFERKYWESNLVDLGVNPVAGYTTHGGDGIPADECFLAGGWDGEQLFVYVDGCGHSNQMTCFRTKHREISPQQLLNASSGQPLVLGQTPDGDCIGVAIRSLRLSRGCRYRENFDPPAQLEVDEATVALYRFDPRVDPPGTADNLLVDRSGNGHDGCIFSAAWKPVP